MWQNSYKNRQINLVRCSSYYAMRCIVPLSAPSKSCLFMGRISIAQRFPLNMSAFNLSPI